MDLEDFAIRRLEALAEEFADLPLDVVARVVGEHTNGMPDHVSPATVRQHLDRERRARSKA